MSHTKSSQAFQSIHEQLDRYESILKMAKIQVRLIAEQETVRQLDTDESFIKNIDSTREFVQCLGNQMEEELNVSKFHAARKISKETRLRTRTVYRWLKEEKEM